MNFNFSLVDSLSLLNIGNRWNLFFNGGKHKFYKNYFTNYGYTTYGVLSAAVTVSWSSNELNITIPSNAFIHVDADRLGDFQYSTQLGNAAPTIPTDEPVTKVDISTNGLFHFYQKKFDNNKYKIIWNAVNGSITNLFYGAGKTISVNQNY